RFIGFVDANGKSSNILVNHIPKLGGIMDIKDIIDANNVEEVIIAIETSEHDKVKDILNRLFDYSHKVSIKIIPDMYDIMLGNVKMNTVYGAVLIQIEQSLMPKWQQIIKRFID